MGDALDETLLGGRLEIFNTDQGAQFTSRKFTSAAASVHRDQQFVNDNEVGAMLGHL